MIVGGMPGLFPLSNIRNGWSSYFMNGAGHVFSTKANPVPRKLSGSTTISGHYYTLSPSDGHSSSTERADSLLRRAKAHTEFKKETALTTDNVVHDTLFNKLKNKVNGSPNLTAAVGMVDRDHATSVKEGIEKRGFLIGRVVGEAIVFGSKPKIHITLKSAKSEIERLANQTPGLQLIYLQIEGAVRAATLVWE